MRTFLDRKNFSSSSNGQVAAHQVTGLIFKRLVYGWILELRVCVGLRRRRFEEMDVSTVINNQIEIKSFYVDMSYTISYK